MIEALIFVAHLAAILILLVAVARMDSDAKPADLGLFAFREHVGDVTPPERAKTGRPPRA